MVRFLLTVLTNVLMLLPSVSVSAGEPTPMAEHILVRSPKLRITDDWLKENPNSDIPKNLYGQTVSVINLETGATLLQTATGDIVSVPARLEGNQSEYEAGYGRGGVAFLQSEFRTTPTTATPFEALQLPPFQPFVGIIKMPGGCGGTFPIGGEKNALYIVTGDNWTKDALRSGPNGVTMARFSVPIKLSNQSGGAILHFTPRIYLQDKSGQRYFPVPDKPDQPVEVPDIPMSTRTDITVRLEAPADDFFLSPVVETAEGKLLLGSVLGFEDWEGIAVEKTSGYPTAKDIAEKLVSCLQYTSTRRGYDRLLSRISFAWLRTGRAADALSVIDRLLNTAGLAESDPELTLLKRLRILALVRTHQLAAAVPALAAAGENVLPGQYREYLMRCCLRQLEAEAAMGRASRQGGVFGGVIEEALTLSRSRFDAFVVATPFVVDQGLPGRIAGMESVQGRYDEALFRHFEGQRAEAKALFAELAGASPEQTVSLRESRFKVVPAALDLLGRECLSDGDIPHAMECFKRMEAYPQDWFSGPPDGEGAYGGLAGAEGKVWQMRLLMDPGGWARGSSIQPDFEAAMGIAYSIIDKYDTVDVGCWEFCPTYGEVAAQSIITCLDKMRAPVSRWETELRSVKAKTRSQRLSAEMLLTLAEHNAKAGNIPGATRAYREVIERYPLLLYEDVGDGSVRIFSLDAYSGLLGIAIKEHDVLKQAAARNGAARIQSAIMKQLKEGQRSWLPESLEKYQKQMQRLE